MPGSRSVACCGRLGLIFAALAAAAPAAAPEPQLNRFETKYYILHTDLDAEGVREAFLRLDCMVDEYVRRTRGFRGRINKRLPFYLFVNPADYYAAGGWPGSAGLFQGDRLMAIAGPQLRAGNWHIVQHEGFHQFVDAVIKGDIPIWVNEGLAEYFGEALFTGDGYVSGVIPPYRLRRVKKQISEGNFKTIPEMMLLEHEAWKKAMAQANYDQAWSMVHFLAHGEDGKYQQRLIAFAQEVGRGLQWERAWLRHFGRDTEAFEARWREYWTELPDHPTADLYAETTVTIMTHHLARAASQKQTFDTAEAFFEAARAGRLKAHAQDWLPPSLLHGALAQIEDAGAWSLRKKGKQMSLVCATLGGKTFTGRYKLRKRQVAKVTVQEKSATKPRPPTSRRGGDG